MTTPRQEEQEQGRISLWIPEALRRRIEQLASLNNRSFSGEVRQALSEYAERQDKARNGSG